MRVVDLIEHKRAGGAHSRADLEALVGGYVRDEVPDYQIAAWLMAVCWRGMQAVEVGDLTQVMAASGAQLDLSSIGRPVADKHSTGGVGDKTSLAVMPLVAAVGIPVGKMSGRGLGFSGGTVDKLESFPGMRVDLDSAAFVRQLREINLVISGQSADLAPADGKLYALRDVTATVASIPLIASSIMSKKLAAGAQVIFLDVKTGSGAFVQDRAEALSLARTMLDIGAAAGRRMAAVVSDMSQPLGRAVGNALEVGEALDTLEGHGPPDFTEFVLDIATTIVDLASGGTARRMAVEQALKSGAGRQALRRMVEAQGGDSGAFDDRSRLPVARLQRPLLAEEHGYVARLDALGVAHASIALGAGRARKGEPIDLAVGVLLAAKVGDLVARGQPLAFLHASDEGRLAEAERRLRGAIVVSPTPVASPALILDRLAASSSA